MTERNGHRKKIGKYLPDTVIAVVDDIGRLTFIGRPVGFDKGWYTLYGDDGSVLIAHFRFCRSWPVYLAHLENGSYLNYFEPLSES